jgi:hypothetical protein
MFVTIGFVTTGSCRWYLQYLANPDHIRVQLIDFPDAVG